MGYYLADGIYHPWSRFVKTIPRHLANNPMKSHFATVQEAQRKDVERAFGVLQKRFAIVRGPVEYWKPQTLWQIMTCCFILHNMIIEDERDMPENFRYISNGDPVEPEHDANTIHEFLEMPEASRTRMHIVSYKMILLSITGVSTASSYFFHLFDLKQFITFINSVCNNE
jgi:hypothetical protein